MTKEFKKLYPSFAGKKTKKEELNLMGWQKLYCWRSMEEKQNVN